MAESKRTANSTKNIIMGIAKNVIMMLVAFIGRRLFIKYIGIDYLGINGLFSNILSLLSMADLGFGTAMSFSFYKPLADRDEARLSALINFYKTVYRFIAASIAAIGLILTPFLDYIINLDAPIPHIRLYYIIFLSNTVVSYLFVYKSSIITADQKNHVVDSITAAVNIGKLIIQCISILVFRNYIIYIVLNVVATVINNILISITADKLYPFLRSNVSLEKSEKKKIFENLKSVFIYKVSGSLLNSVDNIVISVCLGTALVGVYSNYLTITSSIISFVNILFTSLTASVGNLIVTESFEKNYSVFKLAQRVSFWISGFVTVCCFTLIDDFITLWLGDEFALGPLMAFAVSFNLYFSTSMQPIWIFREATGLYQRTKYIMLIAAILNIILSFWMVGLIGISGVIIATILSRLLTYFWYEPKILFEEFFNRKVCEYYLNYFVNVIIVLAMCVVIESIGRRTYSVTGIGTWLIKAFFVSVIINGIYIIINIKSGVLKELYERILRVLKK